MNANDMFKKSLPKNTLHHFRTREIILPELL
jgi:hypothetical protein